MSLTFYEMFRRNIESNNRVVIFFSFKNTESDLNDLEITFVKVQYKSE